MSTEGRAPERRDGQRVVEAHDRIRTAILHGELAAGSVMSQPQLVETLGIGRTPLREALRILQQEGLVLTEPKRRVRIAELSIADLEELYVVRVTLESLAIRMTVPQLRSTDVAELEGLMAQMDHYASLGDYDGSEMGPHRLFHALLVSGVGGRVSRALAELNDHAIRYRRAYQTSTPGSLAIQAQEHRQIVDAAASGDPELAAERLVRHMLRTAEGVIRELEPGYPAPKLHAAVAQALGADVRTTDPATESK